MWRNLLMDIGKQIVSLSSLVLQAHHDFMIKTHAHITEFQIIRMFSGHRFFHNTPFIRIFLR